MTRDTKKNWFRLIVVCLLISLGSLCTSGSSAQAQGKIPIILKAIEGVKEHSGIEPERLLKQTILEEIERGHLFRVVDPNKIKGLENHPPYFVGASLIAFRVGAHSPCRVSLSMQLRKESDGLIVFTVDRALDLPQQTVDSALKLRNSEFDRSRYGVEITNLVEQTYKAFEIEAGKFPLRKALNHKQ